MADQPEVLHLGEILHLGASVLFTEGFGYIFVLHEVDEDPVAAYCRYRAEQAGPVGGPFETEELAKEAGSAALTEIMRKLNEAGFLAMRPGDVHAKA